jgi:hypothetical protein
MPNSPTVILALTRGIEVIADALLQQRDLELVALYDHAADALERNGIPCTKLSSFHTEERLRRADAEANRRNAEIVSVFDLDSVWREYPDFDRPTWLEISKSVQELSAENLFQSIALLDALETCMAQRDVRLVIVPQDICRETKALVLAAKRHGIPSLHLLHGFPYGATNMHDDRYAGVIAVYSERARAIYEGFGFPKEKIVITGNPEWDIFMHPFTPTARRGFCDKLRLDPARPIIVYALTYGHELSATSVRYADYVERTTDAVLKAFSELASIHADWQFCLRPHPNDPRSPRDLPERAAEAGCNAITIDRELPSYASAVIADVMVCSQSNLGIEALFLGKPVVNVVIEELGGPVFREGMGPLFLADDAVLHVTCEDGLAPTIATALEDKAARRELRTKRITSVERFNGRADGHAAHRFSRVALKMMDSNI